MILCQWCGKMIKKSEPRVTLSHKLHFDHLKCNQERAKNIKDRYGMGVDYTKGQRRLKNGRYKKDR